MRITRKAVITVPKKGNELEAVRSAAYLLTDRAAVHIEEVRGAWEVTVIPGTAAREFQTVLENQALRGRLRSRNRDIMEHVVARSLTEAGRTPAAEEETLSPEAKDQIERLLAEARAERKTSLDPLGISRTWEEAHGKL